MTAKMQRRTFITLLGAAAAWPLAAQAQQPGMPVVGYLNLGSPEADTIKLTGLRRGLNQTGYAEGRNFVIEYRCTCSGLLLAHGRRAGMSAMTETLRG
jgi:putative ABC transport system substrate-binding protein